MKYIVNIAEQEQEQETALSGLAMM